MHLLKLLILLIVMLFQGGSMKIENLTTSFDSATQMQITIENMTTTLQKGDQKFEKILNSLKNITKYSHEMPAFGVSLDELTREEMQTGTWLELIFDNTYEYNEMPFDALLIKVEKDAYGFNLIRKQNGKYEGRCFYLSLEGSMKELYDEIDTTSLENHSNDK